MIICPLLLQCADLFCKHIFCELHGWLHLTGIVPFLATQFDITLYFMHWCYECTVVMSTNVDWLIDWLILLTTPTLLHLSEVCLQNAENSGGLEEMMKLIIIVIVVFVWMRPQDPSKNKTEENKWKRNKKIIYTETLHRDYTDGGGI